MSLDAYSSKKRGNIKGKGKRKGRSSRSKDSRRMRAGWNNPLQSLPLPNNLPLYVYTFPDYLTTVPWSYKANPLREMIYYVPISALEVLLKSHIEERDLWKFLYILNLIQLAYFRYQATEKTGWFAPISSILLNQVLRKYRPILEHLKTLGIIDESPGHYYSKDNALKQSRNEFCITPEYRTKTIRLAHRSPKRAARAHKRHEEEILNAIGGDPNRMHIYETMKKTTILPEAMDYIDELQDATEHQIDCYRRSVEAIHNGEYYMITDYKTGRLFTNFTNLWNELREFLRIEGERVDEIDIANSQPLLAADLYPEDSAEKQKYLEIVLEGHFYRRLEAASGRKYPDYKKLKQLVFAQVFFGSISDGNRRPLLRAFKALFPELLAIIDNMKEGKKNKNKLALELQSIEADLVIGKVVNRLRLLGIPCLTVHDSIVCKVSDVERAYEILDQELEKLIGHKCKIKRKNPMQKDAA
jgi:hypothetical protein